MTQEEKAKAYDEALERFKSFKEKYYTKDTNLGDIIFDKTGEMQKDFESIFPQLAESEDDRIRKLLVWQVYRNIEDETNDLAQSVYDGIKGHDPDLEESIEDWKKCLAWLEKQKEASKAIEAVERIDKYIDEQLANAHDMKDSNPEKKYYRGWDDALGKMAGILQDVYSDKKQKEQKPADDTAFEKWLDDWYQGSKEAGGDVVMSEAEFKNWSRVIKNMYQQKPVDFPTTDEEVKEFLETHPKVKVPEKYKTSDFVFSKQEYESQPIVSKDTTSVKPVERSLEDDHIIGFIYDLLNEIEWKDNWAMSKDECLRRLNNYRPQEPVEWNDTDMKEARDNLISVCRDWERGKQTILLPIVAVRARHFLEHLTEPKPAEWDELQARYDTFEDGKKEVVSHPEKYGLCRPAEWSEEDESSYKELIHYFESLSDCLATEERHAENRKWLSFLKSLHPQSQHRDTYYDIIHSILAMLKGIDFMQITPEHRVSLLNDIRVRCKHADEWANILDEPHWKPSEEQILAIVEALKYLPNNKDEWMILNTLIAVLRKLM